MNADIEKTLWVSKKGFEVPFCFHYCYFVRFDSSHQFKIAVDLFYSLYKYFTPGILLTELFLFCSRIWNLKKIGYIYCSYAVWKNEPITTGISCF